MGRSTKTTLSTRNTWLQMNHLHTAYHFHNRQFHMPAMHLTAMRIRMQQGINLMLLMCGHRCLANMDAWNRIPTGGGLAASRCIKSIGMAKLACLTAV